ncbi:hypothetical protein C8F04DRAFT_1234021 [Mycena alexandri]|uniref:G-protein coupled receptors family 2 profile 2 domain-containing protein n=1 Tax=Mycena alexandri TaxID=1745969 RepID=A0AAD6X4Q2_9AGAR|nr:hypothetical protein C8F04DRAFT_1234021 [Mycena alexandri]
MTFSLGYSGCLICAVKLGPGSACSSTAWFANACILFAAIMFFSMALNLQLVLVHGVNGQRMEKYYVSAAAIMALACTIPPYAASAFESSYDDGCWYDSAEPIVRLRWWVASLGLWLFLLSTGEVISFVMIVGSMIMRHRAVSAISTESSASSFSKAPTLLKPPIVVYRNIILRIGESRYYKRLYPLVSCFFVVTAGALDLHDILNPAHTVKLLILVHPESEIEYRRFVALCPPADGLLPTRRNRSFVFTCSACPSGLRTQGVNHTCAATRRGFGECPSGTGKVRICFSDFCPRSILHTIDRPEVQDDPDVQDFGFPPPIQTSLPQKKD